MKLLTDRQFAAYFLIWTSFAIMLSLGGANIMQVFIIGFVPILADAFMQMRGVKG
jgi:hypothetical protein